MRTVLNCFGIPSGWWRTEYWFFILAISICAFVAIRYARRHGGIVKAIRDNVGSFEWMRLFAASFAIGWFYAFALPLQTFLTSSGLFSYSVGNLIPELVGLFLALSVVALLLAIILQIAIGKSASVLLLSVAILGWVQASILTLGLPRLNGETWLLLRASLRDKVELAIAIAVIVGCYCFRKVVARWFYFVLGAFFVMTLAYIADGKSFADYKLPSNSFVEGFTPPLDMAKSISFSNKRNVIVVILDSAPGDLATQVINENPELRKRFDGFVNFSNNIGMHDSTTRGLSALVTGHYLEKSTTIEENDAAFWGTNSVLAAYQEAGFNMYVKKADTSVCYTNRRTSFSPPEQAAATRFCLNQCTSTMPYISLFDVVKYKLYPYACKYAVVRDALLRGEKHHPSGWTSIYREWQLYPFVSNAPVIADGHDCFCFLHTEGVHVPILKDAQGVDLPSPQYDKGAIKNYLSYLLPLVADMLDSIRAKGVYDNSLVILTTDHGVVADPKSALLWIKPFEATGELAERDVPTSHCNIVKVLRETMHTNVSSDEICRLLTQHERKVRVLQVSPDKWWQFGKKIDTYEIIFDDAGKETSRVNLGEFVIN